ANAKKGGSSGIPGCYEEFDQGPQQRLASARTRCEALSGSGRSVGTRDEYAPVPAKRGDAPVAALPEGRQVRPMTADGKVPISGDLTCISARRPLWASSRP